MVKSLTNHTVQASHSTALLLSPFTVAVLLVFANRQTAALELHP